MWYVEQLICGKCVRTLNPVHHLYALSFINHDSANRRAVFVCGEDSGAEVGA